MVSLPFTNGWNNFHLPLQWTFVLFLIFGSCTQSSCEHLHTGHMFLFLFSRDFEVERMGWIIKRLKKLPKWFSKGYTILHFHKQWMRVSVASHSCQHLSCSVFINCNQPNEFMQWYFLLHFIWIFPSYKLCWASLHGLDGHLCIFFCKCPNLLPIFSLNCVKLVCKSSEYILYTNPLSYIFSQSESCLFHVLNDIFRSKNLIKI